MGSRIDNAQRHGVMTCRRHNIMQRSSSNGCNRRSIALASFTPGCCAFLQIGIHNDDLLAVFVGGHGCMNSQCGLTATALLAEERESLHAKSLLAHDSTL